MYPVEFSAGWSRDAVVPPQAPYTGAYAGRVLDDSGEWDGTVHCRSCDWTGAWQDLRVPMTRPAPQRDGEPSHAFPVRQELHTQCFACMGAITWDGWDEPDDFRDAVDIWSHDDTGHFWC
jgi:hypothetical protein